MKVAERGDLREYALYLELAAFCGEHVERAELRKSTAAVAWRELEIEAIKKAEAYL